MADRAGVLTALQSELEAVIDDATSVSSPSSHVGKLNVGGNVERPYIGFEAFASPIDRGIGGNVYVDDLLDTDDDDLLDAVVLARDYEVTYDVTYEADDDNAQLRDTIGTALADHFAQYVGPHGSPTDIHTDITGIEEGGENPANRPADDVRGARKRYLIEYKRTVTFTDFEPMREVGFEVQSLGMNPDTYFQTRIS